MKRKMLTIILCGVMIIGMTGCGNNVEKTNPKSEELNENKETSKVKVITGNGSNTGDEIAIGTEHFYIISNANNKVIALAKYNLDIDGGNNKYKGTGLQDEKVLGYQFEKDSYGTIKFSSSSYWYKEGEKQDYPMEVFNENSEVYTYINKYNEYLNSLGIDVSTTLMTYAQAKNLGCSKAPESGVTNWYGCDNAPDWLTATSFWLSSAQGIGNMWAIQHREKTDYTVSLLTAEFPTTEMFGIRPVITFSATEMK